MESQLALLANKVAPDLQPEIIVKPYDDIARTISMTSKDYDLVILRSFPHRTSAGGLVVSDLTARTVQQIACSVILLGEPHEQPTALR
jgi:hypothetical protein